MAVTCSSRGLFIYSTAKKMGETGHGPRFYFIPEWTIIGTLQTHFITDVDDHTSIDRCIYCTKETLWRWSATEQRQERAYQALLNRTERISGLRAAIYGDIAATASNAQGNDDLIPGPSIHVGAIQMMTAASTVAVLDNPEEFGTAYTEAPNWSEGSSTDPHATGLLVRLAGNNAVFFIPSGDLNAFRFEHQNSADAADLRALVWGKRRVRGQDHQPFRLINVRNALYGPFARGTRPGAATTGNIQMMTALSGPLSSLTTLKDTQAETGTEGD